MIIDKTLLNKVIDIATLAGEEVLTIYHQIAVLDVISKTDDSPLTQADIAAQTVIVNALSRLTPTIPVLSEESVLPSFTERQQWMQYWLVDPLDGTKEFISRNGEFTVNIALIEKGVAVLGVVYVPVSGISYAGFVTKKGASQNNKYACKKIAGKVSRIDVRCAQSRIDTGLPLDVVASRHHRADAVDKLCERINVTWGQTIIRAMGSSLKICLVAEGCADLYPRFGPTSEWDTAAAQAIIEAAGGHLVNKEGHPLRYNQKESILNSDFFAIGRDIERWKSVFSN